MIQHQGDSAVYVLTFNMLLLFASYVSNISVCLNFPSLLTWLNWHTRGAESYVT